MKKLVLSLLFLLIITVSCNKKAEEKIKKTSTETEIVDISETKAIETTITTGDNSQNALDWNGTYKGTIPCADCEGIAIEITLNKDLTFTLKSVYLGKEKNKFNESGTFSWNKEGSTITTISKDKTNAKYKVGENKLILLNSEGKENTDSKFASMYILNKELAK